MYLTKNSGRRQSRHRQHGAALIVGLIMLLLLTLIGVAGLRDTLLQEKMAASMRDRAVALQAAEVALRTAETSLSTGNGPTFSTTSVGLYDHALVPTTVKRLKPISTGSAVSELVFWQQSWPWATKSIAYTNPIPGVDTANLPRYVIEKLPVGLTDLTQYPTSDFAAGSGHVASVDDMEVDDTTVTKPDYRITARGQGLTSDSVVILQSTFRRATPQP